MTDLLHEATAQIPLHAEEMANRAAFVRDMLINQKEILVTVYE